MFWQNSRKFQEKSRLYIEFKRKIFAIISLFMFLWFLAGTLGCAAPPVKLKCEELKARLSHQFEEEDQRRFAEEELRACEAELEEARRRDSAGMEKLHRRFSPEDDL